jgi:hypothetical protein
LKLPVSTELGLMTTLPSPEAGVRVGVALGLLVGVAV